MNFLILAAGTRNKIVQYFKKTFDGIGIVVAADAIEPGPAIYDADKHHIVPSITAPVYIDLILDFFYLMVVYFYRHYRRDIGWILGRKGRNFIYRIV